MSYLNTLNSLLSTTTSRYTSLRRQLLSSSSEDDSQVDDPDSSHVSKVLRAYYTEKGRPFPPWLPPDPKAREQQQQGQGTFASSAGSLRGAGGRNSGGPPPGVGARGSGGGLSDLWADNSAPAQPPPQENGSLRRGLAGARLGARTRIQDPQDSSGPRPLPSQRAGSYQTAMSIPAKTTSPVPPGSSGSGGSVQERLKARLGGRATPTLGGERSEGGVGSYMDGGTDYGAGSGGKYGSGGPGGGGYANNPYEGGQPYGGGGRKPQEVLSKNQKLSNESLLWGPYRPNLYFGVRPRVPKSLTTGLLWARTDNFEKVQHNFRHTCEQHEGMTGYGWDEYDVRQGGRQTIHDAGNSIDLTTEFVKIAGGENGGNWGVRIKGSPRDNAPPQQYTSLIFYAAMEGLGSLRVENEPDELGIEGPVRMTGSSRELGDFIIEITEGPETNSHPPATHKSYAAKPLDRTIVASLQTPDEQIWQAKPLLFNELKQEIDKMIAEYGAEQAPPPWQIFTLPNNIAEGNLHFVQKIFEGAFEFDILYSSASAPKPTTSESIADAIDSATSSFTERFKSLLAPKTPFDKPEYLPFAQSMFSNLIGGIGYFYGDAVVDRSYAAEYEEENEGFWEETAEARSRHGGIKLEGPSELYTSIPSRPFFPRGFLWDEGFHLLPIADWDMDLTLEIIRSWFNLMDEDGWIGREQILGQEARSKVPQEFQVQYPHYANPPTLFLIFDSLIEKLQSADPAPSTSDPFESIRSAHLQDPKNAIAYLRDLYPLLKRHYFWYRKTQWGDIKSYDREAFSTKEAYRWRGRTPTHILTSGLDDYPRPQPPHPGELHTDLISWMGMMTRSMRRIAAFIGESDDAHEYEGYEIAIIRNIDDLHWDAKDSTYCDATIDDYEESVHVCHKGYISIFPFLTGLLPPDSPRLGAILDLVSDKDELWSPYGLRSLSKSDDNYGTGEDYWRSPVWININYLAVKALLDLAQSPGPHKARATELYAALRRNLVVNVFKEWGRTGFAWEQYNAETGLGQRTQHFTGWTSLVVKIMAMPDLSGGKVDVRDEL